MNTETLHSYLTRYLEADIIDFSIRAEDKGNGEIQFYIHPDGRDGDTLDFCLWEDPLADADMLINRHLVDAWDVPGLRNRFEQMIVKMRKEDAAKRAKKSEGGK